MRFVDPFPFGVSWAWPHLYYVPREPPQCVCVTQGDGPRMGPRPSHSSIH
jgi:hypothetical protein